MRRVIIEDGDAMVILGTVRESVIVKALELFSEREETSEPDRQEALGLLIQLGVPEGQSTSSEPFDNWPE